MQRFLELFFDVPLGTFNDILITNSVKFTPNNIRMRIFEPDIVVEIPKYNIIVNLEQQNVYDPEARKK